MGQSFYDLLKDAAFAGGGGGSPAPAPVLIEKRYPEFFADLKGIYEAGQKA
jgi:hypothetical protein